MVTGNRDDFIALTDLFAASGRPHGGALIVTRRHAQGPPNRVVDAIIAYAEMRGATPNDYLCDFLPS